MRNAIEKFGKNHICTIMAIILYGLYVFGERIVIFSDIPLRDYMVIAILLSVFIIPSFLVNMLFFPILDWIFSNNSKYYFVYYLMQLPIYLVVGRILDTLRKSNRASYRIWMKVIIIIYAVSFVISVLFFVFFWTWGNI